MKKELDGVLRNVYAVHNRNQAVSQYKMILLLC